MCHLLRMHFAPCNLQLNSCDFMVLFFFFEGSRQQGKQVVCTALSLGQE